MYLFICQMKIQESFPLNYELKNKRTGFGPFRFFTLENYTLKAKQKLINASNNIKERNECNKSVLNSIKLSRYS